MQNEQFTFENIGGRVTMFTTKKEIPIPVQMTGLKVTRSGMDVRIVLEQIPITITWDSKVMYFFLSIQFIKATFDRPFLERFFMAEGTMGNVCEFLSDCAFLTFESTREI